MSLQATAGCCCQQTTWGVVPLPGAVQGLCYGAWVGFTAAGVCGCRLFLPDPDVHDSVCLRALLQGVAAMSMALRWPNVSAMSTLDLGAGAIAGLLQLLGRARVGACAVLLPCGLWGLVPLQWGACRGNLCVGGGAAGRWWWCWVPDTRCPQKSFVTWGLY